MAALGAQLSALVSVALLVFSSFSGADARLLFERRSLVQSGATAIFIDEIHWDNVGLDFGEAVEIFGPVGTDLTSYQLTRYATSGALCTVADCASKYGHATFTFPAGSTLQGDGSSGSATSGTIVVVFPPDGFSNSGAGIALIDPTAQVLDFISWSSTSSTLVVTAQASTGPASGQSSTSVAPNHETSSTPTGQSIQRTDATTWATQAQNSFGATYQNYYVAGQNVNTCEEQSDGTIAYSTCTSGATTYGPYTSPATQPPAYAEGPRIIGAGNLPSQTVVDGLRASTGYRGNAPGTGGSAPSPPVTTASSPPPVVSTGVSSPPPVNVASPPPVGASPGTCGSPNETPIYAINGNGQTQTIVNQQVVTSGIVTGDFDGANQLNGIYIETPDAQADADPTTSNGLFVYFAGSSRANFPATSPGDYIQVAGTIVNYNGLPELSPVTSLTICSSGNPQPTVPPVTLPSNLRQYISMQVTFPQTLTVTDNYNDDYYGEIELSANGRRYVPTQLVDPGAPAIALEASNNAQTILIDDGSSVTQKSNPSFKPPYPYPGLSDSNTIRTGYTLVGNLNGDLTYGSSYGYEVEPNMPPYSGLTFDSSTNPRPTTAPAVLGSLKVVGMNLENFFTQLQANGCSESDCRGATTQAQLNTQISKEVLAITALNADIYAFQELQNNGFGSGSAIATLTAAVNNKVGAGTYAFITVNQPDGGNPSIISTDPNCAKQCVGGDAITVGMIYRVSAATPVGPARAITKNVDPSFPSDNTRPSVAQTFVDNQGGKITVVANHLKSKGSSCAAAGDPDNKDGQGNCNLTRQKAAAAIVRWLATDPTGSNDPDFLLLGDMNAYAKEDPIKTFESGGFVNMIYQFIGDAAYSYVFNGESGYLDHALASASLAPQILGVGEFHINADEPIALHYDSATGLANPNSMYRTSDHDPVIVGMTLTPSKINAPPAVNPPPAAVNPPPAAVNPPPAAVNPPPFVAANPPPLVAANPPPVVTAASPPPVVVNANPPPVVTAASPPPVVVNANPPPAVTQKSANPPPVPTPTNPDGGCGNACNCPNEKSCTNGASKKNCSWTNNKCVLKG